MRGRRLLGALSAALTLAAASACGSSSNDYRGQVKDAQNTYLGQLQPIVNRLQREIRQRKTAAASRDAARAGTVAGKLASRIERLDPPQKLKAPSAKLVGAYRGFDTALHQLSIALRKHQQTAVQRALRTYESAQRQESQAIDALNAAS